MGGTCPAASFRDQLPSNRFGLVGTVPEFRMQAIELLTQPSSNSCTLCHRLHPRPRSVSPSAKAISKFLRL